MSEQTEIRFPAWLAFVPLVGILCALGAVRGWFGGPGEQTVVLLAAVPLLAVAPLLPSVRVLVVWLLWLLAGLVGAIAGTAIAPGMTMLLGIGNDIILLAGMAAGVAILHADGLQRERWLGAALLTSVIVASSVWWAPATPMVDGYPLAVGHARQFAGGARAVECAALLFVLVVSISKQAAQPGWLRSVGSAVGLIVLGASIDLGAGAASVIALIGLISLFTEQAALVGIGATAVAAVVAVIRGGLVWKLRAWTAGASVLAALHHPLGAGRGEFSAAIEPFVGRRLDVLVYESGRIFRAPENGFVGALVERGWLGLLLLVVVLAWGFIVIRRNDRRFTLPGMVALLLLSLASDPTWTPATALLTGLLFGFVFVDEDGRAAGQTFVPSGFARALAAGMALIAAVASSQVAASQRMFAAAALNNAAGHLDLEEAELVRYADRQRRNEYAWPRLVDKRLEEERIADAWDAAQHWRGIRPNSPAAAATATVAGVAAHAFEEAAQAVSVWHDSRGAHPLWLYRNGVVALAYAQQATDALALADEALASWPDDLELQRLRGRLLMKLGRWEEAFDVWSVITENERANLKDVQYLEYAAAQAGLGPVTAPAALTGTVSKPEQ
ncbi:MAG: hypothetical protein D6761_06000 [Candidatus Dadabacteria bacterium]|nr:MAG: hypothetical protein D6761_06000 [Candidatus Dadabacteria bacterium]